LALVLLKDYVASWDSSFGFGACAAINLLGHLGYLKFERVKG
jgi:hypothetical protein